MATLVLPAPVGAHIRMFSLVKRAVSHTRLWMRLRDFIPAKAGCAHDGNPEISRSFSSAPYGFGLRAGTCTSSYPCNENPTRCLPSTASLKSIRPFNIYSLPMMGSLSDVFFKDLPSCDMGSSMVEHHPVVSAQQDYNQKMLASFTTRKCSSW